MLFRSTQGNAVINMVATLANLLGPALGGVIFGLWGLGPILTIGGVCFFCSAMMEIFIHIPYEKRPRSYGVLATVGKDLGESWRYISRPAARMSSEEPWGLALPSGKRRASS